jgi:hypothetical protein
MQKYESEYRQLKYCCIEIYSSELASIMEHFCNTNGKYNSKDTCRLIETQHGKGTVSIGEGKVVYCVECDPDLNEEMLLSFAGDEVIQLMNAARFYSVHTYLWWFLLTRSDLTAQPPSEVQTNTFHTSCALLSLSC